MKVYVAGRWTRKDEVRAVQSAVRGMGHEITLDWTQSEDPKSSMSQAEAIRYLGEQAKHDAQGVADADAVIVLDDSTGRGLFVELGMALADPEKTVIAVAPHLGLGSCVFYFHPRVRTVLSVEDALAVLEAVDARRCA